MKLVLVERNATARSALGTLMRGLGVGVVSFADPNIALLFLLVRLREVDGVVLNEDDECASTLLSRLETLPASPAVVTYSSRELERGATIGCGASPIEALTRSRAPHRVTESLADPAATGISGGPGSTLSRKA